MLKFKEGQKVKEIATGRVLTIKAIETLCEDDCCEGYIMEEDNLHAYTDDELELVDG